MSKALKLDGVVGSQLRDTQGEMLSVEGADISELEAGRGRWNDNHGKGFFNTIGRITEAKKIFKAEDCENDRHRYYWEKIKAPYIYAAGYLYNDEEHQNAKAAAAILRNIHKADTPLKLKASVEGGVIARGIKDPTLLAQTKIHSVAITFTPANVATLLEPLDISKSLADEVQDEILIKSVLHLAQHDVPSFRDISKAASAIKAGRNIKKIQQLIKKAKEEEMEKGIKEMAAGAAMLGAAAMSPGTASAKQSTATPTPRVSHTQLVEGLKQKNPHLWSIAQIESSGGKNLKHDTLKEGLHAGMTAGGPWGMMPKTAQYVVGLSKKLAQKYPDVAAAVKDVDKNHKSITDKFNKDPQAAYDFARTLYNHIHKSQKGDPDKVIHSWHYGIVGTKKAARALGEDNIKNDEYVSKIRNSINSLKPKRALANKVNKALTAGYGGAGAPSSRTGGAVFQTESIQGNGRDFKRVNCEHCGDEQIYAKHQVKCRGCGKNWSLATLYKVMVGSKR